MTEDILDMMAKAKATSKKKAAKKKVANKKTVVKDDIVSIPDQKPKVEVASPKKRVKTPKVDTDTLIIEAALKKYNGESNIPIASGYWNACNRRRAKMRGDA